MGGMKMENEIVTYENTGDISVNRAPEQVLEEAKRAAKALADVVKNKKKPVIMNGEQYLEFEDWQTVGRFYGVTARVVSTMFIEYGEVKGFEARSEAIRVDGMVISAAEAMCLNDEPNWKSKPLFQLRSMAQTRACAKALRNVLAWVVVLAGYRPTPAEEMTGQENKSHIQEPQKKQNGTTQASPTETIITGIDTVTQKDGVNEKTKKLFTRYTVHVGETKYGTFSKTIAEDAKRASQAGLKTTIQYKTTTYGQEIVTLTVEEPPEDGNAQE
jgi:hypothetical protein